MKQRKGSGWLDLLVIGGAFAALLWLERRRPLRHAVEPKGHPERRNMAGGPGGPPWRFAPGRAPVADADPGRGDVPPLQRGTAHRGGALAEQDPRHATDARNSSLGSP